MVRDCRRSQHRRIVIASATLIATRGIYGLMAYAVTQHRRKIGVRMALGAERRDVLRLLTRALRIVVAGLIVGRAGAAGVTRCSRRSCSGRRRPIRSR
jgi:putative ABC transport system permease protein